MGLLSIFKRQTPEEFYRSLAHDIVLSALAFQTEIEGVNAGQSVLVGAELTWYLLHWLDRFAYAELGEEGRDVVFDNVSARTINEYVDTLFEGEETQDSIGDVLCDILGKRQTSYGKCKSEVSKPGSTEYALACYIHQVINGTCSESLVDKIIQNREVSVEDVDYLPYPDKIWLITILSCEYLKSLDIKKRLKQYISICSR